MKNKKAKIYLKLYSITKFLKTHPVRYMLKQRIKIEIQRMVKSDIL